MPHGDEFLAPAIHHSLGTSLAIRKKTVEHHENPQRPSQDNNPPADSEIYGPGPFFIARGAQKQAGDNSCRQQKT
jgi:hypothetical protein